MNKLFKKPLQWIQVLPPGLQIAALMVALVGGRYLWIEAQRPAHRDEIVAAFGSVGIYSGAPQPDRTGRRFTFVETSDRGYGVFFMDTATGKKTLVFEELGSGMSGDYYDLLVWPWAPDGSAFIYSQASQIVVCDAATGKPLATLPMEEAPAALTWLTSGAFACVGKTGGLRQFEKQPNGTWARKGATDALDNGLSLRRGGMATASAEDAANGSADSAMNQSGTTGWSSGKTAMPVWLQYQFNGAAWAVTQYKLTSSGGDRNTDPRDWELLGSLDGSNWSRLDARTNQTFGSRRESRRYAIQNTLPYSYYRLNITATADGATGGARLSSFQLWSPDTPDKASASRERLPLEGAAAAFDGSTKTKWYTDRAGSRGWLQYQFGGGAAWALSGYDLTSANDVPNRDPRDWQFQASNDGRTWTTLDTQSGQSFASRLQTNSYTLKSATPYRYYRLNITANQDRTELSLQLAELSLKTRDPLAKAGQPENGLARQSTGGSGSTLNAFAGAFSLTSLSSNTIAWGQGTCLWSMNLAAGAPNLLLDLKEVAPPNTTLASFSYSGDTGQFLLCCEQGGQNSLWRFAPDEPGSRFTRIATPASVRNAVWLGADKDAWIGMEGEFLIAQKNSGSPPSRLLSASIDAYAVSPDGQRLLLLGIMGQEPAAGIWSYDLASTELKSVVPYADYPSPRAQRIFGETGSAIASNGEGLNYDIYTPTSYAVHTHRKYPLVIGDTYFGNVLNGAHGRLWIPALAASDAYVVVVNRRNWADGIEHWGEDVMAVYKQMVHEGRIDTSRVFLFGVSAETRYMSDYLEKYPGLWKGAIFLNPTGIPDFSKSPPGGLRPRILFSAGEREHPEGRFKKFQAESLPYGVLTDYIIGVGQAHHFVGNAAQLERTKALVHFVCDE